MLYGLFTFTQLYGLYQIYNDNKTIDSSDYHIDVYLFT
ncbi:hypothetical protein KR874_13610 [Staphylococcus aureus]|nr:hypothetical protein [Staphylococcus aureus]